MRVSQETGEDLGANRFRGRVRYDHVLQTAFVKHISSLSMRSHMYSVALRAPAQAAIIRNMPGFQLPGSCWSLSTSDVSSTRDAFSPDPAHGDPVVGAAVFFRIIDTSPSRARVMKLSAGAAADVHVGDIVITLHAVFPDVAPNHRDAVSVSPMLTGSSSALILRSLAAAWEDLEEMQVWELGEPVYCLEGDGLPPEHQARAAELLTAMVSEGALPGSDSLLAMPEPEAEDTLVMDALQALNIVQRHRTQSPGECVYGYQLTRFGVRQKLRLALALERSSPVGAPREVDLGEKTEYELMKDMETEGWVWLGPLTPKRPLQPYCAGGPKFWGTKSRHIVGKEYMIALLQFEDLTTRYPEVTSVPHGRDRRTYVNLLLGQPAPEIVEGDVLLQPVHEQVRVVLFLLLRHMCQPIDSEKSSVSSQDLMSELSGLSLSPPTVDKVFFFSFFQLLEICDCFLRLVVSLAVFFGRSSLSLFLIS